MKRTLFLILIALAICSPGFAQDKTPKPSPTPRKASFAELVERVKKSDATVNFADLRMAYTETKDYSPYGNDRDSRQKMFAALNAKEFDHALEFAEKILAKNYVEINAHFGAYIAHRELGHAEQAAFHKFVMNGLLKSITSSGDGKSIETAYVVISTDEEYTLFNFLGVRPSGQALLSQNGHSYDRMTTVDPKTNETVVYFFNVDKPFNWMGESLKH